MQSVERKAFAQAEWHLQADWAHSPGWPLPRCHERVRWQTAEKKGFSVRQQEKRQASQKAGGQRAIGIAAPSASLSCWRPAASAAAASSASSTPRREPCAAHPFRGGAPAAACQRWLSCQGSRGGGAAVLLTVGECDGGPVEYLWPKACHQRLSCKPSGVRCLSCLVVRRRLASGGYSGGLARRLSCESREGCPVNRRAGACWR